MENFMTSTIGVEETEAMKSKDSHAGNPFASSRDPLPYDPMLGWYTAATLSGLLLLFLACVGLEKVKDKILMTFEKGHQANVCRGGMASHADGCDAGQQRLARTPNDDPKCSAENDALLGRNCIDHNYVYLTLDRSNHVEANQSGPAPPGYSTSPAPRSPGNSTTRTATDREKEDVEPLLSTAPGTAEVKRDDETRTTTGSTSSVGAVQTHSVKIEIVEVHSESPVHEMAIIEEKDVNESVV